MKPYLPFLALGLGFGGLVQAQDLQRSVDFKIIHAVTFGETPPNPNSLTVRLRKVRSWFVAGSASRTAILRTGTSCSRRS